MQGKIKILFFGNDYFGGQFLKEILDNHSDKFEVVGIATNLQTPKLNFIKKLQKAKRLFRKKVFFSELKEKVFFGGIINKRILKNPPPLYPDIKAKDLAKNHNIPFFDSTEVYKGNVEKINSFNADYIIIASFGKVPEIIYKNSPSKVINYHPSYLPELRGGCPVYSAIRKGMKYAGLSFHLLSQKFDAGPLLYQEKIPIHNLSTTRQIETQLAITGASKLFNVLSTITSTSISPIDVSKREVSYCYKSYEISARIIPSLQTTTEALQLINASISWSLGSAYIQVGFRQFYIIMAESTVQTDVFVKKSIQYSKSSLLIKTSDGTITVKKVYYRQKF